MCSSAMDAHPMSAYFWSTVKMGPVPGSRMFQKYGTLTLYGLGKVKSDNDKIT